MKKILSILFVVSILACTLLTAAFAQETQKPPEISEVNKVTVDILNESGSIVVKNDENIVVSKSHAKNKSIALAKNPKGELFIAWLLPSGDIEIANLGVSPSNINLYGSMSLVNLHDSLKDVEITTAIGSNIMRINNRASSIVVYEDSKVKQLLSVADSPIIVNGSVEGMHVKSGADVTVNGKMGTGRVESGSVLKINGEIATAQILGDSSIEIADTAKVNNLVTVNSTLDLKSDMNVTNVVSKDSVITVNGVISNALLATGISEVDIKNTANVKMLDTRDGAKANVSGVITKGIVTDGLSAVIMEDKSKVAAAYARGESILNVNEGASLGTLNAVENSSVLLAKGSESLNVYASGATSLGIAGNVDSVTIKGDASVRLLEGSNVVNLDNSKANNQISMDEGSSVGEVEIPSKIENKGGTIDPDLSRSLPHAMPSFWSSPQWEDAPSVA